MPACVPFGDSVIERAPGDKLFVYTDGVPEATDAAGKMFSTGKMVETLNTAAQGSPKEVLRTVKDAVNAFVGDAEQFDDLTMLCLEYKGTEGTGNE